MNSFDILRRPIISERSMETVLDREGNEIKRYTFEVPKTVNKVEIKKAVEEAFGVKVAKDNTMMFLVRLREWAETKEDVLHGKRLSLLLQLTAKLSNSSIFNRY